MQYPASSSYRNNPRTSLRNARGEFPASVHGPYKVARAEVNGEQVVLDRLVSRHTATTGEPVVYMVSEVGADSMECLQLSPGIKVGLAEFFSPNSGNVEDHIRASKGESSWLFCRAPACRGDRFMNSLREGGRNCTAVSEATMALLVEHYERQAYPSCQRIELVYSLEADHEFVRVVLRDGSSVVHDQWINPEAFLSTDGKFGTLDDLVVHSAWQPGDPLLTRWEDLKTSAKVAGEIRNDELPQPSLGLIGDGSSRDMVSFAKRQILANAPRARTEATCLLQPNQVVLRGMRSDEKIAYHHNGVYFSNDVVAESSIQANDDLSFPAVPVEQARWELEMEAALGGQDFQTLSVLLQRIEVRERFPDRHRRICLHAVSVALRMPPNTQILELIGILCDNAIDSTAAMQLRLMVQLQTIENSLMNRDASSLGQLLTGECIATIGDQGARWLMIACDNLDARSVKLLLNAGACFGAPHSPDAALFFAIAAGGADLAKLLLKRGASASRRNVLGLVPWQFAQQQLRDSGATGENRERQEAVAVLLCRRAMVEALAHQPADAALLKALRSSLDDEALPNAVRIQVFDAFEVATSVSNSGTSQ